MTTDAVGLYIHIPFCRSKCRYCDFASYGGKTGADIDLYIDALASEIKGYKREERIRAKTVYLGGGTPSLLSPSQLLCILDALRESFDIEEGAEVTLEANPGTVSADTLAAYHALGVNRLSLGLQSIHENELKFLGRIHSYEDFLSSYTAAREVGFDNISVDLMYGIPEQTEASFEETLRSVIALSPEHLSVYGLILEEGTPFFDIKASLPLPDEDAEYRMYLLAIEMLGKAGYSHYEISNYAKAGYRAEHNSIYWKDGEYIGVGCAAYSYFEGERYGNPRSLEAYLRGDLRCEVEAVDRAAHRFEYAMLALRLKEGIDLGEYERLFGRSFTDGIEDRLDRFISMGLMTMAEGRLAFTDRGFYLSNSVMADIVR
ncbi:MAG: radical SAM family heme chaperone HemW [Clostridia bacterium]|nr:radical SAM family heme chaperone HemW [Clostridia bacterium]